MPDNCENWLGLINTDVYYACQNRQIYQMLPYSMDYKAPSVEYKAHGELWNWLIKTALSKCYLFVIK